MPARGQLVRIGAPDLAYAARLQHDRDHLTRRDLLIRGAGLVIATPALCATAGLLEAAGARAAVGATVQRFASRPDLRPPVVTVLQRRRGLAPGLVFVGPSSGPGQAGAMIVDNSGDLVWFHPVRQKVVTDFKVQKLHGEPVLTWWEGASVRGPRGAVGRARHLVSRSRALLRRARAPR
jgi:hypothetical protein